MNLKKIPFFKPINEKMIERLLSNSYNKQYIKGEIIHMEDDTCNNLEIILSGHVAISYNSPDGDLFTIRVLGENSFISPNNLFASEERYFVYVEALKKTTILNIPKESVEMALKDKEFTRSFLTLLSDTGRMMGYKLVFERKMDLREKIWVYLKHQAIIQESKEILLPMSKTSLANNFGVARTSLSRELQRMRLEGIIEFSNRIVLIKKDIN